MPIASVFKYLEAERKRKIKLRAGFLCALEIETKIPKTTHESCRREKNWC